MAVAPLFVSNMTALKSALKLSGSTQTDTATIIDRAVQEVRLGFFDHLGSTRVTEIGTYSSTDNPSSTEEIARVKAETAEILWVKSKLLRDLPSLFMDSSGNTDQVWNEEGLTREANDREIKDKIASLEEQVFNLLGSLAGSENVGTATKASTLNSSTTPIRPGQSLGGFTVKDAYASY